MQEQDPGSDEGTTIAAGKYLRLVRRGTWEYAERLGASGAVCIIAVTDDRKLVLIEQERPAMGGPVIELPADDPGDAGDAAEGEGEAEAGEHRQARAAGRDLRAQQVEADHRAGDRERLGDRRLAAQQGAELRADARARERGQEHLRGPAGQQRAEHEGVGPAPGRQDVEAVQRLAEQGHDRRRRREADDAEQLGAAQVGGRQGGLAGAAEVRAGVEQDDHQREGGEERRQAGHDRGRHDPGDPHEQAEGDQPDHRRYSCADEDPLAERADHQEAGEHEQEYGDGVGHGTFLCHSSRQPRALRSRAARSAAPRTP